MVLAWFLSSIKFYKNLKPQSNRIESNLHYLNAAVHCTLYETLLHMQFRDNRWKTFQRVYPTFTLNFGKIFHFILPQKRGKNQFLLIFQSFFQSSILLSFLYCNNIISETTKNGTKQNHKFIFNFPEHTTTKKWNKIKTEKIFFMLFLALVLHLVTLKKIIYIFLMMKQIIKNEKNKLKQKYHFFSFFFQFSFLWLRSP